MSIGQEFDGPIRPSCLAGPHDSLDEIGPAGQISGRQGPADEGPVGWIICQPADELILIAVQTQDVPGLLDRDGLHAPQQVVGNLRPSIRTPISLPLGGHGRQLALMQPRFRRAAPERRPC